VICAQNVEWLRRGPDVRVDRMEDAKVKLINQKRANAAEEACRAFRKVISMRVVDATERDWSKAMDYLFQGRPRNA
jgi:hypothetical protein